MKKKKKIIKLTKCVWYNNEIKKLSNDLPLPKKCGNKKNKSSGFVENQYIKCESYTLTNKNHCKPKLPKNEHVEEFIRTLKIQINFTESQKEKLFEWFKCCDKVYNKCVSKYNSGLMKTLNYKKEKIIIFSEIFGKAKKECPYDILTDEVRCFCSNVKSAISNKKNHTQTHFRMKTRQHKNGYCICIPKKSIREEGIFPRLLGKIREFDKMLLNSNITYQNINSDSKLIYDNVFNKFYLLATITYYFEGNREHIKESKRDPVVAIDPGEKIPFAYYSINEYGKIGEGMRKKILFYEQKIRKLQRALSRRKNKKNKFLKNRKTIINHIKKFYRKIKNCVTELHNKTAIYLCRKFNTILLPEFKTQNMIKNNKKSRNKIIKDNVKKIMENSDNPKQDIRNYSNHCRMNGRVKFVLNMLSHYKFKQKLQNKVEEYGCRLITVTEEFTSQCCSKCGHLSSEYKDRLKHCPQCDYEINRDINGARNILIKNYNLVINK